MKPTRSDRILDVVTAVVLALASLYFAQGLVAP
jgi:hypothetical protein